MRELPLPAHFDASRAGDVWRVSYEDRAREASAWAERHGLRPAADDPFRLCLLAVDVQNTFCIPGFELFVAGRSGTGAVDDNRRLCEFVYRNLGIVTQVLPSLDTHDAMQVFHAIWLFYKHGAPPDPYTLVSADDVETGRWRMNPAVAAALGIDLDYAQRHLAHYTRRLAEGGKYDLTVWPYHAMLGGIGHALASAVEEAIFFHGDARAGGHRGPGRRSPRRMERRADRGAAHVRCRRRGRAGQEPLRGVDDRRPARGRRGARAACPADVPARGLHVCGRRARRGRLHG